MDTTTATTASINLSLFLFTFSLLTTQALHSQFSTTYTKHCNHIIPQSQISLTPTRSTRSHALRISSSFYINPTNSSIQSDSSSTSSSFYFAPRNIRSTIAEGVFSIEAYVTVKAPIISSRAINFALQGFWSENSKRLCMVGTNFLLKLTYPNSRNLSVFDCLVKGVLVTLDDDSSVSILGVAKFDDENYQFMLSNANACENVVVNDDGGGNLPLDNVNKEFCSPNSIRIDAFELDYGNECRNVSCDVPGVGYLPKFMIYKTLNCVDNRKFQMLLGFRNSSHVGGSFQFDPRSVLIAEGKWDQKKNQICAVACRIMNYTHSLENAVVGDCSVRLSLRSPAVWSIKHRSSVMGQIWSNKTSSEQGYFGNIGFHNSRRSYYIPPSVKYEYANTENVTRSCEKFKTDKGVNKYPRADSANLRFDMFVKNSKGQRARGFASPLFVGDRFYQFVRQNPSSVKVNISYQLVMHPFPNFEFGTQTLTEKIKIASEGSYASDTGVMCMQGCRHLEQNFDCDIVISIKFSPLYSKDGEQPPIKGTIKSTRKTSDPLYFKSLELSSSSIYTNQAKAAIWRMDLEITMVLISNSLACVFIVLQLFHVRKHENVLSHISLTMLVSLALAHMIPLLLNFDAMFKKNHSRQNAFLGGGGWLEVNEIIVRVITMFAFLLQVRLLQLSWSARNQENDCFWGFERKVLYVALPLYICGGLMTWLVHHFLKPSSYSRRNLRRVFNKSHLRKKISLWVSLRSYGGLILDGFLLPQILLNIFSDSTQQEHPLAMPFYVGITLVRMLPHAYDLYRAHSSMAYLDASFIYANPKMDLYSTAWDIIIPCGGFLLAILIFLQQRYGGRSVLPKRFRQGPVYEKVPPLGGEELQGEKNFFNL
ncbi:hypothetical protein ACFE04_011902 [Oxalis oulophora]